jgi:hypothetical protein
MKQEKLPHGPIGTIASELDAHGCAPRRRTAAGKTCAQLIDSYDDDAHFRSRIVMARHGFARAI